jgi:hypothetical protein
MAHSDKGNTAQYGGAPGGAFSAIHRLQFFRFAASNTQLKCEDPSLRSGSFCLVFRTV